MEWVLIILMNSSDGGQVTQSPAVMPGFSTEAKCKIAGEKMAMTMMDMAVRIHAAKAPKSEWFEPFIWSDCVSVEK